MRPVSPLRSTRRPTGYSRCGRGSEAQQGVSTWRALLEPARDRDRDRDHGRDRARGVLEPARDRDHGHGRGRGGRAMSLQLARAPGVLTLPSSQLKLL